MGADDLVDFDIIEGQKENIQSLPGGRSAKKLADAFSASPLHKLQTPTPADTKNVNDSIRFEYEAEVASLAESDDPLDIFDRYVRWTLDAYPSAQATPQSGLHTLLERATKTFVKYPQYKNDPRYLKMWMHYIHFFSDAPRETFIYLSRHGIGDRLALYYEEYATWLENAGRWAQADEIYQMGIENEAHPGSRLLRKFTEFQQRMEQQPEGGNAPSSPALPTMRPALAAKIDPFAAPAGPFDPQAPRANMGVGGAPAKKGKAKLAIFSDADASTSAPAMGSFGPDSQGWDTIGSLADRKKENVMEPKPWVGEVLKAGGKKSGPKMAVFKDQSKTKSRKATNPFANQIVISPSQHQVTVNPQNGKKERVFVDLSVLYSSPEDVSSEKCFEEVWAQNRGWLDVEYNGSEEDGQPKKLAVFSDAEPLHEPKSAKLAKPAKMSIFVDKDPPRQKPLGESRKISVFKDKETPEVDLLSQRVSEKLLIHHDKIPLVDENGATIQPRPNHGRKKLVEVNETMVVRDDIELYDENGAVQEPHKGRKKKVMEANETQTIKAKLDSPTGPKMPRRKHSQGAEPTMTMHTRAATDDIYDIFNQPVKQSVMGEDDDADLDYETDGDYTSGGENTTRNIATSEVGDDEERDPSTTGAKSVSEWSEFTARKHIPDFQDSRDETDISAVPGEDDTNQAEPAQGSPSDTHDQESDIDSDEDIEGAEDRTTSSMADSPPRTVYIPMPPEDYVAPDRPYRDPGEVANNRLPFMTPITERTESSLGVATAYQPQYYDPKTPSKDLSPVQSAGDDEDDDITANEEFTEPLSSPLREIVTETSRESHKISQPQLQNARPTVASAPGSKPLGPKAIPPKGPLVTDLHCNPVDEEVRREIFNKMVPGLSAYDGFYNHEHEECPSMPQVRKWAKAGSTKSEADGIVATLKFSEITARYTLKKELGVGAFAPVYLVHNSDAAANGTRAEPNDDENSPVAMMGHGTFASAHSRRSRLEAVKIEQDPPSAWEFHMIRLSHSRLGVHERATRSLTTAKEMHMYKDSSFLVLPYYAHGGLLDVVNHMHREGLMEEQLAMFFAIELFRTAESLHAKGIAHGDIKTDNCLLRLDHLNDTSADGSGGSTSQELGSRYRADGSDGWADRGITLIDFGRGIDMRAFHKDVAFFADWQTSNADPIEMREGRPWTWQIDYYGLANTVHSILFGKYMEVVRYDSGGLPGIGGRKYKIRESLKRYWQTDIWASAFEMLLNPVAGAKESGEDGGKMPLLKGIKKVRTEMEGWLEKNCERGTGLRGLLIKVENFAVSRSNGRKS